MTSIFTDGKIVSPHDLLVRSILHVSTVSTIILLAAMVIAD